MYKPKLCGLCGEIKVYDCERCYGIDDAEKKSVQKDSDKCSNKCSKAKKN